MAVRNDDSRSALDLAARAGHVKATRALVISGADLVHVLFSAVRRDDVLVIQCFTMAQTDLNTRNEENMTPLMVAAQLGKVRVLRLLLESVNDCNSLVDMELENGEYNTAFWYAAKHQEIEALKMLIKAGVDLHEITLKRALIQGFTESVRVLVRIPGIYLEHPTIVQSGENERLDALKEVVAVGLEEKKQGARGD